MLTQTHYNKLLDLRMAARWAFVARCKVIAVS